MASQEAAASQERALRTAKTLQDAFERTDLQLLSNVSEFTSHKADLDDADEEEPKDPAIIADDVASQMVSVLGSTRTRWGLLLLIPVLSS